MRTVLRPRIYQAAKDVCKQTHEENKKFQLLETKILSLAVLSVRVEISEPPNNSTISSEGLDETREGGILYLNYVVL